MNEFTTYTCSCLKTICSYRKCIFSLLFSSGWVLKLRKILKFEHRHLYCTNIDDNNIDFKQSVIFVVHWFRSLQKTLNDLHDYQEKHEHWQSLQDRLVQEQVPGDVKLEQRVGYESHKIRLMSHGQGGYN